MTSQFIHLYRYSLHLTSASCRCCFSVVRCSLSVVFLFFFQLLSCCLKNDRRVRRSNCYFCAIWLLFISYLLVSLSYRAAFFLLLPRYHCQRSRRITRYVAFARPSRCIPAATTPGWPSLSRGWAEHRLFR